MKMKKSAYWTLSILLITAVISGGILAYFNPENPSGGPKMEAPPPRLEGFNRAKGPRRWDFPRDFGPHPSYQTEWWYYTGNLHTRDGRRFGYQLTLFRRGLLPPEEQPVRASSWAADQVYMGHFALTDVSDGAHHSFERFSRGAAGLAGAEALPLHVWLENWQIRALGPDTFQLEAAAQEISLDLTLKDRKGLTFHGLDGYSRKGPEPGNASYYFSQTRLATNGEVKVSGAIYQVEGTSWMDHEFSTSALSEGQAGWDWFSLQLEDGTDVMVYQIRRQDGEVDPFSSGTLVSPEGIPHALELEDFEIQIRDTWRSPHTGAVYPSSWTVRVSSMGLTLEIDPLLKDQEMEVSYVYWEGAVRVTGERSGHPVTGTGYVELTGYPDSMEGEF